MNRILISTVRDIDASKLEYCEDRRIQWTIYKNISICFDNWEDDLIRLGFAFEDDSGNVTIPNEQLRNNINFNETCLSIDGSQGRRGGRPEIVLHDPRFPMTGKSTNKDSLAATLICGSNAADKALVPHFQFKTKATLEDRQRMRTEMFAMAVKVRGVFGRSEEREYDVTFGMNTKEGMDDREFVL